MILLKVNIIKKSVAKFEMIQKLKPDKLTLTLNISPLVFILNYFTDFIDHTLDASTLVKNQ